MQALPNAPIELTRKVFLSQCSHLYGCQAWDFSDRNVKSFHPMWNRCVRKLLCLPLMTHVRFLPELMKCPHSWVMVAGRFLMKKSNNVIVRHVAMPGMGCANSIISHNLGYINKWATRPKNKWTFYLCSRRTRSPYKL